MTISNIKTIAKWFGACVALLVVGFLVLHRITHPTDKNHLVVINSTTREVTGVEVSISQGSTNRKISLGQLRSLGLKTENVPHLFASRSTVTVSVAGKSTTREVGSHGRYGHTLVVVLGERDVFFPTTVSPRTWIIHHPDLS